MSLWLPSNVSDAVKELVATESGVSQNKLCEDDGSAPAPIVHTTEHDYQSQSQKSRPPYTQYGGRYCCVVGCTNNQGRDGARGITFHRFPR